jgi:hypothetical protein
MICLSAHPHNRNIPYILSHSPKLCTHTTHTIVLMIKYYRGIEHRGGEEQEGGYESSRGVIACWKIR